jgi:hypothetical protein
MIWVNYFATMRWIFLISLLGFLLGSKGLFGGLDVEDCTRLYTNDLGKRSCCVQRLWSCSCGLRSAMDSAEQQVKHLQSRLPPVYVVSSQFAIAIKLQHDAKPSWPSSAFLSTLRVQWCLVADTILRKCVFYTTSSAASITSPPNPSIPAHQSSQSAAFVAVDPNDRIRYCDSP